MSTYEARCASVARDGVATHRFVGVAVTPELVEAAIERGRRERSLAIWSMLQAVFGRRAASDQKEKVVQPSERTATQKR